jgi:hypothetical protein
VLSVCDTLPLMRADALGAGKFLEQIQLQRELCWSWCWHTLLDDPQAALPVPGNLPAWSSQTLAKHARDPRPQLCDAATCRRGETGDAHWNAMQRQLRKHGELHPALRGAWGRKVLDFTAALAESIARCLQLNDKFALDGVDPCGVCGVLASHGLFGAAAGGAGVGAPVYGALAPAKTQDMMKKIKSKDLEEYTKLPIRGDNGGHVGWETPYQKKQREWEERIDYRGGRMFGARSEYYYHFDEYHDVY